MDFVLVSNLNQKATLMEQKDVLVVKSFFSHRNPDVHVVTTAYEPNLDHQNAYVPKNQHQNAK